MITINYRDPRPIYEQIQTELRRLMLTGVLPPGMPAEMLKSGIQTTSMQQVRNMLR